MQSKTFFIMAGVVLVALLSLYFIFSFSKPTKPIPYEVEATPTPEVQNFDINIIGEIASFDAAKGIVSFKENFKYLNSVSAFLYDLNPDGSISFIGNISREQEADLVSLAKENNVQILLGIGNDYKSERLDKILNDEAVAEKHILDLTQLIIEGDYDGVAVDFENIQTYQTDPYTSYLRKLTTELKSQNKFISVAVNTETRGSILDGIDVIRVSEVVDRIDLNSFDEFGPWSGPGPIASIGWLERIVRNAVKQGVPTDKIVLGIATSGKDWYFDSESFFRGLTTKEYLEFASKAGVELIWDDAAKSSHFDYQDLNGREHIVWLEDAQSTLEKINLAKNYRINGVFIWFLGGEDPNLWRQL